MKRLDLISISHVDRLCLVSVLRFYLSALYRRFINQCNSPSAVVVPRRGSTDVCWSSFGRCSTSDYHQVLRMSSFRCLYLPADRCHLTFSLSADSAIQSLQCTATTDYKQTKFRGHTAQFRLQIITYVASDFNLIITEQAYSVVAALCCIMVSSFPFWTKQQFVVFQLTSVKQ